MEYISSNKNEKIKDLKKLEKNKGRKKQKRYLIEGEHIVHEAILNSVPIEELYATEDFMNNDTNHLIKDEYGNTIQISDEVAKGLSETVHPQGIFAVVKIEDEADPDLTQGKWLLMDNVQDPGNVGTMIRTADAAGFAGVILSEDSADYLQPKVQRSMQGSQFHINLYKMDLNTAVGEFQKNDVPVYGTLVNDRAKSYKEMEAKKDFALIMGNEAHGMSDELADQVDQNLYIPMPGKAESLNVAIAAGILMFSL